MTVAVPEAEEVAVALPESPTTTGRPRRRPHQRPSRSVRNATDRATPRVSPAAASAVEANQSRTATTPPAVHPMPRSWRTTPSHLTGPPGWPLLPLLPRHRPASVEDNVLYRNHSGPRRVALMFRL